MSHSKRVIIGLILCAFVISAALLHVYTVVAIAYKPTIQAKKKLTKEEDVIYIQLDEGERLEGITFNPNDNHMYILTKMDTCKPTVHYIQEFRRDRLFEVKVVVQEQ